MTPPRSRGRQVIAGLLATAACLLLWALVIEPARLVQPRVAIRVEGLPSFSVALLSDIHAGCNFVDEDRLRRVVSIINGWQPDLVALLGDYVTENRWATPIPPEKTAQALGALKARAGVFAVLGNHDWWHDGERARAAFQASGIQVLEGESALLNLGGKQVRVLGVPDATTRGRFVQEAYEKTPADAPVLALSHSPDVFPLAPSRVRLLLAGHTHGGQVRLPILGALVVPSRYKQRYVHGHVEEKGKHLYVTSGLGMSIFPVRFGVPPEVVLLQVNLACRLLGRHVEGDLDHLVERGLSILRAQVLAGAQVIGHREQGEGAGTVLGRDPVEAGRLHLDGEDPHPVKDVQHLGLRGIEEIGREHVASMHALALGSGGVDGTARELKISDRREIMIQEAQPVHLRVSARPDRHDHLAQLHVVAHGPAAPHPHHHLHPELLDQLRRVDRNRRDPHPVAHHRDLLAPEGPGEAKHPPDRVDLTRRFQELLGDVLRPQRVAWHQHHVSEITRVGGDMWSNHGRILPLNPGPHHAPRAASPAPSPAPAPASSSPCSPSPGSPSNRSLPA